MNKNDKIKYTVIAIFFALFIGVIYCLICEVDKLKKTEAEQQELITETTADSVKTGVIHLTEDQMDRAENKTIKLMADTIERLKNERKIYKFDKIAYVKQIYRDTVRIDANYANDAKYANRISHKIELDTTIYRPWSEIHLIVNDSIIIDYLTRSELMVTFGVQKYDNHKTWIGRLLHRDKKRKVAHVSETNPHIILEQSEFIENENDD